MKLNWYEHTMNQIEIPALDWTRKSFLGDFPNAPQKQGFRLPAIEMKLMIQIGHFDWLTLLKLRKSKHTGK